MYLLFSKVCGLFGLTETTLCNICDIKIPPIKESQTESTDMLSLPLTLFKYVLIR